MDANVPPALSAKDRKSFAYLTIKERLPVILAKIADTVFRIKGPIKEHHGEEALEDLKLIAGCVSKMRNELMTSKALLPIQDDRTDTEVWNEYLKEYTNTEGKPPSWFTSPWLYVECYMYRRIEEAIMKCACLKGFDVFRDQKQKALTDSHDAVMILVKYLWSVVQDIEDRKAMDKHTLFKQLMQVCLWGNKCDLSISAGFENSQTACPLDQVNALQSFILLDNMEEIWNKLQATGPARVDIVLDNAGFEVVTDLCLAEFLLSANLATSVHFHGKAFPWFVSDVTRVDLDYTLQHFTSINSMAMDFFTRRWKERLVDGTWVWKENDFWTLPFPYCEMQKRFPDLYADLGQSSLVIFKGDLNYRKLVGDRSWPTTATFQESLQGFSPAPICSLRALKADVVTGLKQGQAEEVAKKDKDWMVNGNWAVIAFCDKH